MGVFCGGDQNQIDDTHQLQQVCQTCALTGCGAGVLGHADLCRPGRACLVLDGWLAGVVEVILQLRRFPPGSRRGQEGQPPTCGRLVQPLTVGTRQNTRRSDSCSPASCVECNHQGFFTVSGAVRTLAD